MMKFLPVTFFLFFSAHQTIAQDYSGHWKGSFIDKSATSGSFAGTQCDYVIDIVMTNGKLTGTSYTYFTENGKRYYTICSLSGVLDIRKKNIEIQEIARTKTNVPSNVNNCFQVHTLTYSKQGNVETLTGNWKPAINQGSNCGYGTTSLTKKNSPKSYPDVYTKTTKPSQPATTPKGTTPVKKTSTGTTVAVTKKPNADKTSKTKKTTGNGNTSPIATTGNNDKPIVRSVEQNTSDPRVESRKINVIKTIEATQDIIKVDLYDNGYIDGDSVTIFFNGKMQISDKKLSQNAISLTLNLKESKTYSDLVMFAENLGSIPPNTAVMVVTDGSTRYEIGISSDLETSGVIRFMRKK